MRIAHEDSDLSQGCTLKSLGHVFLGSKQVCGRQTEESGNLRGGFGRALRARKTAMAIPMPRRCFSISPAHLRCQDRMGEEEDKKTSEGKKRKRGTRRQEEK